jgi:hypothetical protein
MKKFFCTDLDNTLIYSYKREIGNDRKNVEIYQGREISFITGKTFELLEKAMQHFTVIPLTTRTEEQYRRIDLGVGTFRYALVCNGGVLLTDEKRDAAWYEASLRLVEPALPQLQKALAMLENEPRRTFELRFIENLFLFTKCDKPENVVKRLKGQLEKEQVDVFCNGEKVYVVPVSLSKGNAIRRLRAYLKPEWVIAAGDSEFDCSMVKEADVGLVPHGFCKTFSMDIKIQPDLHGLSPCRSGLYEMKGERLFSEELLEACFML